MYIPAFIYKHMHGYCPLSADWQAVLKSGTSHVCVSVVVCVVLVQWQSVQADGRLDGGSLVQTGFPALPLCFCFSSISPQCLG